MFSKYLLRTELDTKKGIPVFKNLTDFWKRQVSKPISITEYNKK